MVKRSYNSEGAKRFIRIPSVSEAGSGLLMGRPVGILLSDPEVVRFSQCLDGEPTRHLVTSGIVLPTGRQLSLP